MGHLKAIAASLLLVMLGSNASAQVKKPAPQPAPTPPEFSLKDEAQDIRLENIESRVEGSYASLNCNTGATDGLMMRMPKIQMFARCEKVEPYLEGHRITVQIGNPYTFVFSGIKGELRYGKEWGRSKVAVDYPGDIHPGNWQNVVVTINPSAPEELRVLHLRLEAGSLRPSGYPRQ